MSRKDPCILLVEDDDIDRMAIQRAFNKNGLDYPLFTAKNGLEALHMLRGDLKETCGIERPMLVLLDLNMPTMNGFEFLAQVRKDPELKDAVVFVLTTSGDSSDMQMAYNYNVAGYIVKSDMGPGMIRVARLINEYNSSVRLLQ